EQHEMRVGGTERRVGGGLLAGFAAAEGEVRFEAEDRPDLSRLRFGVEGPRAVEIAVVRGGERIHAQRPHPVQQVRDPVGAVEEGVLAVRVEMNERHGYALEDAVFCAVMQWLMLALTFVVMAVLQRLARGGGGGGGGAPLEARARLARGFLTLAAYAAGTIAQRLRLPGIAGYLVAG